MHTFIASIVFLYFIQLLAINLLLGLGLWGPPVFENKKDYLKNLIPFYPLIKAFKELPE
jgi:hypothetical protein